MKQAEVLMMRPMLCGVALLALASATQPGWAGAAESSETAHSDSAPARKPVATPSPIADRFALRVSFVDGRASTLAQIDDTAGGVTGTAFSAESDFGLPNSARQARAEFIFRLHERGRLRVSALDLSRKGSVWLTRTVRYGDQTFQIGERVNSLFDWRMFDFTWTYSFLRTDRFELGAGLGFHFIQAEASAVVPARQVRESFDGAGPFVTLALDSTWCITRRFSFSARYQTFDLTVSDVSARLYDAHADVQFRWHRNFAVGLGYQSNNVRLQLPNENPGGSMRLDVSGPELFVRASF